MSKTYDFEAELARVVRRANRLRAAIAGEATITRVEVKRTEVRKHWRKAHVRLVITPKEKRK